MTFWQTMTTAGAALVGGAIGSLGAPWANWQAKKARSRRDSQQALVASWRELIQELSVGEVGRRHRGYLEDLRYQTLARHLSASAREKLERPLSEITVIKDAAPGVNSRPETKELAQEVDRIERDWGLP